jgi:hypothetical protein
VSGGRDAGREDDPNIGDRELTMRIVLAARRYVAGKVKGMGKGSGKGGIGIVRV